MKLMEVLTDFTRMLYTRHLPPTEILEQRTDIYSYSLQVTKHMNHTGSAQYSFVQCILFALDYILKPV
jgi:hypothetical protein